MAQTVLLVTDCGRFAGAWSAACARAGLGARVVGPEGLPAALVRGAGAVLDGASASFDEDELLAHVALARALGALPAVVLPEGSAFGTTEDVLAELCGGLVARADADMGRVIAGLGRRCDSGRQGRFEYLCVSPRGGELIAVLADGSAHLLPRPIAAEDDGSDIDAIQLAEDARSASIVLSSGPSFVLSALDVTPPLSATSGADGMPTSLHDVDGVRVGRRLRALRLAGGLTQAELARRTGMQRPNIARVEAGRHTPALETLARLASAIGVPIRRLLSD